ncbi:hypothetical protein CLV51_1011349 [Chitinophaga niastensis]|uniref:HTH cro/C1-type domain-containing protein n=1 Tax=Chitinophaga niastensis TaxID=536980 RepID=A0A2P8HUV0_CHINA|nr:helix-turn-helix transcriptional regulator [Chitinophaga niastensis]PSL50006.1 hypothetical protein CLV51_1011349 [Chitinophaga niastensis]
MQTKTERLIKTIRIIVGLTQEEMANAIGIKRVTFRTYEKGRKGSHFFYERFKKLYGIDLHQSTEMHKIIFVDTTLLSADKVAYLIARDFNTDTVPVKKAKAIRKRSVIRKEP